MHPQSGAAYAAWQAIKASGALIEVDPQTFQLLLARAEAPLVVAIEQRILWTRYQYIVGYRGLVFFTRSKTVIQLPGKAEVIQARRAWLPR
jgi:hypothetical protein